MWWRRLGVSKIYVWDNGSDPPLGHLLQKYIMQGVVAYEHFTTFEHPTDRPQLYAYDRCARWEGVGGKPGERAVVASAAGGLWRRAWASTCRGALHSQPYRTCITCWHLRLQ